MQGHHGTADFIGFWGGYCIHFCISQGQLKITLEFQISGLPNLFQQTSHVPSLRHIFQKHTLASGDASRGARSAAAPERFS